MSLPVTHSTISLRYRWIVLLALFYALFMSAARLVLFYFSAGEHGTLHNALAAFTLGVRYDFREVGILVLFMLILSSIPVFNPFKNKGGKRFWSIFLAVINVWVVSFYVMDFIHFDYLTQRLNASALNFLEDASTSATMVWQTYPVIRLLVFIIAIIWLMVFVTERLVKNIAQRTVAINKTKNSITFVLILLLAAIGIFGKLGQYPLRWSDAFSLGNDRNAQLALNPFQSFFSSFTYRHSNYDEQKAKEYYPTIANYLGIANTPNNSLNYNREVLPTWQNNTIKPNIVLVICESFSAYKSSMWGNPLNPTPFFNSICEKGIFFDHCFTPHFGTARGVWATISGIPDVLLENTASRNPLIVDQHSIISDFKDYEKYYFIGGSTSWANIKGLLMNNLDGLHLYEGNDYKDVPKIDVWGISDKNLFLQASHILGHEPKPFFAVIQTADNHRPYTIPKEDRAEFRDVKLSDDSLHQFGFQRNDELNAFRFTDFCFKKFIEAAQQEKYFNNTIFIFVGDHGIRGDAGNMFPKAWTDNGLTSFHVPLLFYSPGLLTSARYSSNCSQLDVLPTIAGLARIPYTNTAMGRDLLKLSDSAMNMAFIIDHDTRRVGVVSGNYFYSKHLVSGEQNLVSIVNNEALPKNATYDSLSHALSHMTDAFYETSKYLLFHNKKKR